jgi:hypothetical protein
MKHKRESLIQVTSIIPISKGWTTISLSCCWRRWCRWSQRGNRERLRQRIPSYPRSLQNCMVCFMFFCRPLAKSSKGVYIIGFRSRRLCRVQDCVETTHERGDRSHHVARRWARMVPLSHASLCSPLTSSHGLLFPKK